MTIKDIAKESGVGLGTVSRVLNEQNGVSEATREKVQAVIDKYGFVLNQNAKLLKTQERRTIVILIKGSSSIFLNSLLEGIQKRLEPLPYTTDVVVIDEYDNEAQRACRCFYERKPAGMIFLGGNPDVHKDDFAKVQIPCVIISNFAYSVDNPNISSVSIDDREASACMAEYLLKKGHSKIGIIGGNMDSPEPARRRFEHFTKTLAKHGVDFDSKRNFVAAKYSFEDSAQAARTLLKQTPDITAIFTMADVMAIGAIRALKDMGYSVPEDISVTGFDGLDLAKFYCPSLTTIQQKNELLVEQGLSLLLDRIEHHKPCKHILVPFEFIEGESVRSIGD